MLKPNNDVMVSWEIISLFVFASIVGVLLLRDRKNVNFHYGIVIRRWTKGVVLIDRLVKRYPVLIRKIGTFGVFIGLLAGVLGTVMIIVLTVKMQQTFGLVLPTAGGYQIPGPVFSVPFWYWLIAIFIIATTHETMHAVFIRLEKVPLKNYGILMLLLLPIGAFVDPDNNRIKKLAMMKKLRIFAAGSFANFAVGLVAVLLFVSSVFAFGAMTNVSGIVVDSVSENSPADKSNLQGIIKEIDGEPIKNGIDFIKALNNTKPGDEVRFATDKGDYLLALEEHPAIENRSFVGVTIRNSYDYNIMGIAGNVPLVFLKMFFVLMSFLNWLLLISVGVGVVNLLPIKPLDGGLFFGEIFTKIFKNRGELLINIFSIILVSIQVFNIFGMQWLRSFIG